MRGASRPEDRWTRASAYAAARRDDAGSPARCAGGGGSHRPARRIARGRIAALSLGLVAAATLVTSTSAQSPAPAAPATAGRQPDSTDERSGAQPARRGAPAQPSPRSAQPPAFQEEIKVHLVQIPILAWDRQGNPVKDLRADEIVVKDRGDRREAAFLEPFVKPPVDAEPLPEVALRVELPGVAERVVTSSGSEARNIIFLIDVENDQPLGKERAAHELMRFVEADLDDSYRVAVLSYNGEIAVELPFTRDRTIIAAALDRAFARPRRPQVDLQLRMRQLLDRFEDCVVDEGIVSRTGNESCMESVAYEYTDETRPRAEDFLTGLEAVIRYASGLEGRKSVVGVSHGVAAEPWVEVREAMKAIFGDTSQLAMTNIEIMSGEGARHQMDDVIDLAIRSEVTLHFVDRTLAPTGGNSARQGTPLTPGARPVETAYAAAQTDLKQIAEATGGTFVASLSLYDGAKRAVSIEQAGYYLGFYTEGYLPRNRLSKVAVDTTRKGVRIAHSRGTYATAQGQTAEAVVRGKIALGKPTATRTDRLRVPFQVAADPRDIGYQRVDASAVSNFTFHLIVEDENSRAVADSYHFVSHSYPWETWQSEETEPILINGWVELPAGRYRLVAKFSNPRWPDRGGRLARPLTIGSKAAATAPPADLQGEGSAPGPRE